MKVAVDAQQTVGTATGIGEYVRGLLAALPGAGIEALALRAPAYDPWRFDRRVVWDQLLLPLAAATSGAQLLHCTSGSVPLVRSLPVVVTVHDVAWLRTQGHTRWYARSYFGRFSASRWRGVRAIVVDSAFSRDELLGCVAVDPNAIEVVYPGVDAAFGGVVRAPRTDAFVLAVGTVERRKNLAVVIEALARVPDLRLISVGPPTPYQAECAALAARCGVEDRVEFRGYVDRDVLLDLYARAAAAVVPSRYEGFGYGAAQALCAGLPLLASRSSSLVEVVAGDGELLDVDDPAAWSAALTTTLGSAEAPARAAAARARSIERFAWSRAAERTAAVYRRALGAV